MAEVKLAGVQKIYNRSVHAVKNLDMVIEDRKVVCLLGPSGCGKTTTMRMVAGLEEPTDGEIFFDREAVTYLTAGERDVAMVFQFPTVYPYLSVWHNLSFPLKRGGFSTVEVKKRVDKIIEYLRLPESILGKKAGALGPGLRQKIAIGRAIVREPKVFLFDEPLTNLDSNARSELLGLIKHLSRDVGQTFIYVTHDQSEAMSLADSIAVMKDGSLIQYDDPDTIYEYPSQTFIGWFLGNPGMNCISCELREDGGVRTGVFEGHSISLSSFPVGANRECILGIRPEYIRITNQPETPNSFPGTCVFLEYLGGRMVYHVLVGEKNRLRVKDYIRCDIREGDTVYLSFPENKIRFFTPEGIALKY